MTSSVSGVRIAAGPITGNFISIDIPEVAAGEDIRATIDFYAINPGALYWATYLVVDSGGVLGGPVLLDKAREIGAEGGRQKTYNLGKMPDRTFTLFFYIFGHDDAAHDWDWAEYDAFIEGYPTPITYLDSRYITISPGAAPPPEQFEGSITEKELEYDGARANIPAYNIPQGERGLVHIWGRNDMDTPQKIGIHWRIKDPDGIEVEEYVDWAFGLHQPGSDHQFIGGRFDLDKQGPYTILARLMMNFDNPEYVDTYSGNLCTVAEAPPPVEYKTLEIDITPVGAGYVTTEPAPIDIENHWTHDDRGQFEEGTRVRVTAHPNLGYVFDHWSDEIQGGVSYNNPEWVSNNGYMYDNKAVKAHFREEAVETETLEIDITPVGSGYVTTNPPPLDRDNHFEHNDTGEFEYNQRVQVTAHPYEGYRFDHWSDEIQGGTSTNNPEWVAGTMTEHRAVKAHFVTSEEPPPGEYELVQDTIYPWAYIYEGKAEVCTFEFKITPEQIPGTEWLGARIVDAFVSELEKEGARLLELKVSRDTSPTFWTNYRVEVTATASPLPWTAIIIGVMVILFIVAIIFAIKAAESLIYHRKGLDEETKKTFARDTLTAMILDLAPETPPETLEAMEDQELRDLLNRLLAEVAPPVDMWPLVALGVLGVGGLGAVAMAYALTKPTGE